MSAPLSGGMLRQKTLLFGAWRVTMKVKDFHSMDGHAARQSGRLSMMRVYYEAVVELTVSN